MRRRLLVVAATAAALFLTLTALVAGRVGPLIRADAAISTAARHAAIDHPAWRTFMAAVTASGSPTPVTLVAVTAVLFLLGIRRRREAVFVAATMLSSAGLRLVVLNVVARARPTDRLGSASGYAFPSGHTTESATAALVALAVLWPYLRGARRQIVSAVAVGWAIAVGISRVALVVHWPSDVLGGWLLAAAVVASALLLLHGLLGEPSEPGTGQLEEA